MDVFRTTEPENLARFSCRPALYPITPEVVENV